MRSAEAIASWPRLHRRPQRSNPARVRRPEPRFASAGSFPKLKAEHDAGQRLDADPNLADAMPESLIGRVAADAHGRRKLIAVIAGSCLLHASVALMFLHLRNEDARIAGSDQAGIAMIGNAERDQASAGEPDAVEVSLISVSRPRATKATTVRAVERAERTRSEQTVAPTAAAKIVRLVGEISKLSPVAPAAGVAAVPQPVEPAAEGEPVVAAQAVEAPPVLTAERIEPAKEAAAVPPAPRASVVPHETSAVPIVPRVAPEPVRPPLPEKVEVTPEPRPAPESLAMAKPPTREQVKAPPEPDRKPKPERGEPSDRKAASGARGLGTSNSRRGSAQGRVDGTKATASIGGSGSASGNAAVSNYPGKVVARLRRALRYPAMAERKGIRGEAQVRFVVSGGGDIGSVRLVRSSGSPILDEAALETVRRAAPFPPIPPEAGRSSWPFTVPLAFRR